VGAEGSSALPLAQDYPEAPLAYRLLSKGAGQSFHPVVPVDYAIVGTHHKNRISCAGLDEGSYRPGELARRLVSFHRTPPGHRGARFAFFPADQADTS